MEKTKIKKIMVYQLTLGGSHTQVMVTVAITAIKGNDGPLLLFSVAFSPSIK